MRKRVTYIIRDIYQRRYLLRDICLICLFVGMLACTSDNEEMPLDEGIFIPTGFSPTGVNKCFIITGVRNAEKCELIILDRHNNIMFKSKTIAENSPNDCDGWWDGRNLLEKEVPSGNYFYQLTLNGNKIYKGYVVLKR